MPALSQTRFATKTFLITIPVAGGVVSIGLDFLLTPLEGGLV